MSNYFLLCLIVPISGTVGMYFHQEELMQHGELPPPEEEIDLYEEVDNLRTQLYEQERQRISLQELVYDIADGLERHNNVITKMADYLETVIDENNSADKEDYIPDIKKHKEKNSFVGKESLNSESTLESREVKSSESNNTDEVEETGEQLRSSESQNFEQTERNLFSEDGDTDDTYEKHETEELSHMLEESVEEHETEESRSMSHSEEEVSKESHMLEESVEEHETEESHSMRHSEEEGSKESHMLEESVEEHETEESYSMRHSDEEESKESHTKFEELGELEDAYFQGTRGHY